MDAKNFMKRCLSLIMAFIITLGALPIMPTKEVQAAPGDDFTITAVDGIPGTYNLTFRFNKPTTLQLGDLMRRISGYQLYYRNVTKGTPEQLLYTYATSSRPTDPDYDPEKNYVTTDNSPGTLRIDRYDDYLDYGCLYTFRIRVLYQEYQDNLADPWQNVVSTESHYIARYATLTDIRVDAIGEIAIGSSGFAQMTVTWDLPIIAPGTDFFTGYNIYVSNISGENRPLAWGNPVAGGTIAPSDIDSTVTDAGDIKGESSFYHSDLHIGNIYAVRVEPVWNGIERIDLNRDVNIGGATYLFRSTRNQYFTDRAYVRPNIRIEETSLTSMDIIWEDNFQLRDSLSGKRYSGNISSIEVWQTITMDTGGLIDIRLTTITGDNVAMNTRAAVSRPSGMATYYIIVNYSGIQYVPPLGNSLVTPYNVVMKSIEVIYSPGALDFAPYRPDILDIYDNRQIPLTMTVNWRAFFRNPYTEIEKENLDVLTGKFLDKDITYEIAITDDPTNFDVMRPEHLITLNAMSMPHYYTETGIPYLSLGFNRYYSAESRDLEAIVPNKIYYVRILAIRNATDETSQYAYDSYYIMPIGRIPSDPNTLAKPPLRIKTVVIDGTPTEVVDETSITIEWDEQWFELYNPQDDRWYSKAGFVNGQLAFGDAVSDANNILYNNIVLAADETISRTESKIAIRNALSAGGVTAQRDIVLRMQDIRQSSYMLHAALYEAIATAGYEEYYEVLINQGITSALWMPIEYTVVTAIRREYTVSDLQPGTPYAIFIWPYFDDIENNVACYPSYVSATTLIDRGDMEVEPTVPVLIGVGKTDSTITVRWKYSSELSYELRFHELMINYPSGGHPFTNEEILDKSSPKTDPETGEVFIEFTIEGLYPNTVYYIWVGASGEASSTVRWSNPIDMRTDDLEAPAPPKSLGPASNYSVETYNRENGTNYAPTDYEYIIVEWIRISADLNNTTSEPQEGQSGTDIAQYLINPSVFETYMVKFNQLVANRIYYIRAKTRLLVVKNEEGPAFRIYSYIVQFSSDENFVDFIEIEVPAISDISSGIYKDSEWISVALKTDRSNNEYDADKDPEMYPLPDRDFEIIYDDATNTLIYRFRSSEQDQNGNQDNQVDERFISRLISNRVFEYYLDLSTFGGRTPRNRVIEFPYSIISAFNERKIGLRIRAGDYTVSFPYGSFNTSETTNLTGLNKTSKLIINIAQNPEGITEEANTNYLSTKQRLNARLTTAATNLNIVNFAKPLNMNFAASGAYIEGKTNIGAYIQDGNTNGWQRLDSTSFDTITKSVNFTAQRSANFSLIGIMTPWSETKAETLNQMYAVNSKLSIIDLGIYNESIPVNIAQFNKIMAATLKGDATVAMNTPLSSEEYESLGKARILVAGLGASPVSREEGISAMVRLFEIKTKYPITGFPNLSQTGYIDIANAAEQFRTPLLKAVELGFYRSSSADPKSNLSFGDLMHMLNITLHY